MASVIQSVRNSQKVLKSRLRSGVGAGVLASQSKLKTGLGLTARIPVPRSPLGAIPKTGGTLSALDFADGADIDDILR